jgi:hypothetical protein
MKAPWIVLLAVLATCGLGAGVMWRTESARAGALAAELEKSKFDNAKLSAAAAAATEKALALESESAQLRAARALTSTRLEPEASPMPRTEEQAKPKEGFLAKMFKDPEMRKMMVSQQAGVLRGFYADYVKQAHLTPDEMEQFFNLLQDRQMALMDSSANMLSGSAVDTNAAMAATDTANDALKALLGPARFGQYQDYEKTLGDRIQVQQFSQQLGAAGAPLQDNQSQALIQIMSQEQANMPNLQSANGAGMQQALNMSPSDIDQYSQQLNAMNQRVYDRAVSVLTPQQLTAFGNYQKTMAATQLAGLKMAQQMFKGNQ